MQPGGERGKQNPGVLSPLASKGEPVSPSNAHVSLALHLRCAKVILGIRLLNLSNEKFTFMVANVSRCELGFGDVTSCARSFMVEDDFELSWRPTTHAIHCAPPVGLDLAKVTHPVNQVRAMRFISNNCDA